ncbi:MULTISPECIES: methyl-accepting chemotaxis protein [Marinomonas]|uniref:Methyl-accepting chemotaxis protein n=1 Tax=Marinomonas arctica TaxID=383750 RepID=A0A7H1J5Q9_9GAMM|nr:MULTISPECIES: methyl-accepting chemotaxis protein [Marinomonas]MCS7488372.1 chemotaxis protein [Marinomonas sp. BSi20414]QNT05825.1 methyl-accepting chemotaxis protein [Marinomonas arctica]GGN38240.1 methyl-accepting chemotaxis protein [Marinomonas arctica]
MKWQSLSVRSRMFSVLAVLLVASTVVSVSTQALSTLDTELEQLKKEVLPTHLSNLASQISNEITPLITASHLMTNDNFVEDWVRKGAADNQISFIEAKLKSVKDIAGSDSTFYVLNGPNGLEYFGYEKNFFRTLLPDYPYKEFYPNFLATGHDYELNLQYENQILFINYRSNAVDLNTNKPYSVAGLGIKADKLINMVQKLKVGPQGRAMLVTSNGVIQAKGDSSFMDRIEKSHISSLLNNKSDLVIDDVMINEQVYYLGSLWVPVLDRFIMLVVPKQQIMAPIYKQLQKAFLYSVVFILISLLILHFVIGSLTRPIVAIGKDVRYVSDNLDLNYQIKSSDKAEIGALAGAVNSLLRTLKGSLMAVNDAVKTTDGAIEGLNQQVDELSKASEAEKQSIGQIASATQDITEQSAQVKDLATRAGELSDQSNAELQQANKEVQSSLVFLQALEVDMTQSKTSLTELNENIEKIVSVLNVISSISEQTNLLALNAAIEAARAGEHGRGFAVVSDEVRMLSQRTSESTNEIQSIISQLRAASTQVTSQMDVACEKSIQTLGSQKLVSEKVMALDAFLQQLFEMNEQVAERAGIQNASVADINQHLSMLAAQSEQTVELFHQSRAATNAIGEEMRHLKDKVELFKVT